MGSATFDQQSRLTVSLPTFQLKFVNTRSRRTGKAKSQIIQDALRLLEAKELDEQLKEGALANAEQDLDVAEEERVTFWSL